MIHNNQITDTCMYMIHDIILQNRIQINKLTAYIKAYILHVQDKLTAYRV